MKTGYKWLIVLLVIIIWGNFHYLFTWTREALTGWVLGAISGIIAVFLVNWIIKKH